MDKKSSKEEKLKNKLSYEQKVSIGTSNDKSLRRLASKHGVHFSTVNEIKKETDKILYKHWENKSAQVGRSRQVKPANADNDLKEQIERLEKELSLKKMQVDWLELQLKWSEEHIKENKIKPKKQLKKKEKKEKMNLAILHEQAYPDINQYERLDILGMTSQGFSYSCKSVRERLDRESSIPDEDILALIKQIINHPFLGGAKGALKLLEDQKAYI